MKPPANTMDHLEAARLHHENISDKKRECTKGLRANMVSWMLQYVAHTGSPGVQRALDIVSRLRMLPAHGPAADVRGRGVHVLYEFVRLPGFSVTVSRKQLLAMATSASVPCVCDCVCKELRLCRLRHLKLCDRSLTKVIEI